MGLVHRTLHQHFTALPTSNSGGWLRWHGPTRQSYKDTHVTVFKREAEAASEFHLLLFALSVWSLSLWYRSLSFSPSLCLLFSLSFSFS